MKRRLVVSSLLATLGILVLASCSTPQATTRAGQSGGYSKSVGGKTPTNGTLKEDDQASVTVAAQWMGEKGGQLVFGVTMNTHSVDLDQYDLSTISVLTDDSGQEYRPTAWQAEPGGHHRSGTLDFPLPASLEQGQARYVKLIVKGIAGVGERVFEWDL